MREGEREMWCEERWRNVNMVKERKREWRVERARTENEEKGKNGGIK